MKSHYGRILKSFVVGIASTSIHTFNSNVSGAQPQWANGLASAMLTNFRGPVTGACCFSNGVCEDFSSPDCTVAGGSYQGDGTTCAGTPCDGACCLPNGSCTEMTGDECTALNGFYQGFETICATTRCEGACCFVDGSCVGNQTITECAGAPGIWQGPETNCAGTRCSQDRVSSTDTGSVLIFSKVDIRYDSTGEVVQDTFIDLTNNNNDDVRVQMYFVNGDTWAFSDTAIELTNNQPTFWSARTGESMPPGVGVSPFEAIGPPIPDPDGSTDLVIRGFIVAFAVNLLGQEIRWNFLKGDACVVNYRDGSAWEYNTWAFQTINPTIETGEPTGDPGVINLDGVEFAPPYGELLIDFYSVGSAGLSGPTKMITVNPDLTLHPVSADFRDLQGADPITTKANFTVWNMNEVKFSELHRCITCWDQTLMANYGAPNHFLLTNIHTDKGKARVNGVASQVCDFDADPSDGALGNHADDVISEETALLGVRALFIPIGPSDFMHGASGINLVGMGSENAIIYFDTEDATPKESTQPESSPKHLKKNWKKSNTLQLSAAKKSSQSK